MASDMRERWSSQAEQDYDLIITYLLQNWTKKEASNFIEKTENTIERIKQFPSIGPPSEKYPSIRKTIVVEQVTLFYSVQGNELHIITLWSNLQDPKKLDL